MAMNADSYAAAFGKVGAFVGTYVIPIIQKNAPNETRAGQVNKVLYMQQFIPG
jgi:hypothetical protein